MGYGTKKVISYSHKLWYRGGRRVAPAAREQGTLTHPPIKLLIIVIENTPPTHLGDLSPFCTPFFSLHPSSSLSLVHLFGSMPSLALLLLLLLLLRLSFSLVRTPDLITVVLFAVRLGARRIVVVRTHLALSLALGAPASCTYIYIPVVASAPEVSISISIKVSLHKGVRDPVHKHTFAGALGIGLSVRLCCSLRCSDHNFVETRVVRAG